MLSPRGCSLSAGVFSVRSSIFPIRRNGWYPAYAGEALTTMDEAKVKARNRERALWG